MADPNQKAEIFELDNGTMRVLVTNYGCTITSLSVPDKDGIFCCSLSNTTFFFFIIVELLMIFCSLLSGEFCRKIG